MDSFRDRAEAVIEAGKLILKDPALPRVAGLVVDIYKLTPASPSMGAAVKGGKSALEAAVPALRAYRYTLKNPWSKWTGIAAVLGIPFLLGYFMGSK